MIIEKIPRVPLKLGSAEKISRRPYKKSRSALFFKIAESTQAPYLKGLLINSATTFAV